MSSSSPKSRKTGAYHHGDLRQALIEAARTVLREEGTGKLSLRAVARRAGVSHAAAYYHFEDKTSLIAAVAIAAFDGLNAAIQKVYEQDRPLLERFKASAFAYITFALDNPQEFRIMFLPELRSDAVRTEVEKAGRAGHDRTVGFVRKLQEEGHLVSGDSEGIAISVWSMVHGLATLMIDGPLYRNAKTRKGREALIAASVTHLLGGIIKSDA